ncbi:MAG: DUF4911 domain-containing protein [Thermodesulfobacteriota bacterium]
MTDASRRHRARIAPERIGFLRFILEGYDGLAILTTQDNRLGIVEILVSPDQEAELLSLLGCLAETIGWEQVEPRA